MAGRSAALVTAVLGGILVVGGAVVTALGAGSTARESGGALLVYAGVALAAVAGYLVRRRGEGDRPEVDVDAAGRSS